MGVWAVAWVVSKEEEDTTTNRLAGSLRQTTFLSVACTCVKETAFEHASVQTIALES